MLRSGFRKARDAAIRQHAAELSQHSRRIRHMMKSVQAEDAVNRSVLEIDPLTIEEQELGRGSITGGWITSVQLAANPQCCGRDVAGDHPTTELRKKSRSPAGAGAKLKHRHTGTKTQSLQHDRKVDQ